jgi:hypothetical protein
MTIMVIRIKIITIKYQNYMFVAATKITAWSRFL